MINHKRKFIYTKISRTASSSVTQALRNTEGRKTHNSHYHILDDINQQTQDYFKFTFVRNPWERLVSKYFYARKHKRKHYLKSTFTKFAKSKGPNKRKFRLNGGACQYSKSRGKKRCPHLVRLFNQKSPFENQLDWISDHDGNVLVDFIGRFENLQEDFDIVCDKIGIPKQKLPHKYKSRHKHYAEYYDDKTRDIVAKKYSKDIEYFGYEFGE